MLTFLQSCLTVDRLKVHIVNIDNYICECDFEEILKLILVINLFWHTFVFITKIFKSVAFCITISYIVYNVLP